MEDVPLPPPATLHDAVRDADAAALRALGALRNDSGPAHDVNAADEVALA
jgi:hypothetical protein